MWPARPGAPRACARPGAPAGGEATSGGGRAGGGSRGGRGTGQAARPRVLPPADGEPKPCAARAERSEAPVRHWRPDTGSSATKLLLSLFSLSVELKLREGWERTVGRRLRGADFRKGGRNVEFYFFFILHPTISVV